VACIARRRGRYVLDWRDHTGARRWRSFPTKAEAEQALSDVLRESGHAAVAVVDPKITLGAYSARWLEHLTPVVKPATLRSYSGAVDLHVPAVLKTLRVRQLTRGHVRELLSAKLAAGLSRNTVRIIHATLRAMLNAAIEDGVLVRNPADRLGKSLRLVPTRQQAGEEVKALTSSQLDAFLGAAEREAVLYFPIFYTMAKTGMRLGEAVALRWSDIDLVAREITVSRTFSGGALGTPKSGKTRRVDVSRAMAELLEHLDVARKADALETGRDLAELVFPGRDGQHFDQSRISKVFKRILKAASLPSSLSPHALRHTLAIRLIKSGAPLTYVRDLLGHSSITVTADVYARHLPTGDKALLDRLEEPSGSKTVAAAGGNWSRRSDLNRGPADYESAALPLSYAGYQRLTGAARAADHTGITGPPRVVPDWPDS
jgi:integrase